MSLPVVRYDLGAAGSFANVLRNFADFIRAAIMPFALTEPGLLGTPRIGDRILSDMWGLTSMPAKKTATNTHGVCDKIFNATNQSFRIS
jgi:hypothetical protein